MDAQKLLSSKAKYEKSEIKVSVIIPIFNGEKYLEQCLKSICNQTLREIEIICINDGSTDGSAQILEQYKSIDERIDVYTQNNRGAGAARNLGLQKASGQYLSFLDADDYFDSHMLENAYNKITELESEICVFCAKRYNVKNNKTEEMPWALRMDWMPPKEIFNYGDFPDKLFSIITGWTWDKLFKTSFIRKNNITFQEQRTTNDARFVFLAFAMAEKFCTLKEVLVTQRGNQGGSLSATRDKSWDCFYKAILSLEEELKKRNRFAALEQAFQNWVLDFSLWNLETISGPRQKDVFNLIKNDIFPRYHIWEHGKEYYLWDNKYKKTVELKSITYEEYIWKYIDTLKRRINVLENEANTLNNTIDTQNNTIRGFVESKSYRLGRAVTCFPRKVKSILSLTGK